MRTRSLFFGCLFPALLASANTPSNPLSPRPAKAGFEENMGQIRTTMGAPAPFVRFRLSQSGTSIFLLDNGVAYQFNRRHYPEGYAELVAELGTDTDRQRNLSDLRKQIRFETFRMDMLLEGASPNPRITTGGRSSDYTHYYTHDVLHAHTYTRVIYHDVYPGIDWVVYTTDKGMKYDFVVRPGADPDLIRLRFEQHEELYVDAQGGLIHGNRMGRFTEQPPLSFQDGKVVPTRFVLQENVLQFAVDEYDRERVLTIDPDRVWGTYYGGEQEDAALSCAVDASGNVLIAGYTMSITGIAEGGHQNTHGGIDEEFDYDVFLAKFNANGVRQWATYYGGTIDSEFITSSDAHGHCAVDAFGNVYLSGQTWSNGAIATIGSHQETNGGVMDAFLVKFDPNGVRQWATYYGGEGVEEVGNCSVDSDGNVFLSGRTNSLTSIAHEGYSNAYAGGSRDAFLVKFNTNGVREWGTYFGGSGGETGTSCSTGSDGSVYLSGATTSSTSIAFNGHQDVYSGGGDAFIVRFNNNGDRLWATYYGGQGNEGGLACTVDGEGNVYMAGSTNSLSNIASIGAHQEAFGGGDDDAFIVKFNQDGVRQWSTYYGGDALDVGNHCAVDNNGNAYLTGGTYSFTGIAEWGYQNEHWAFQLGGSAASPYLVKFNTDGVRQWGTYYANWTGLSCATYGLDAVYLAGRTFGGDVAFNGHQNVMGSETDGFLARFTTDASIGTSIVGEQRALEGMKVFPNPSNGLFAIHLSQHAQARELAVFDATGRLVLSPAVTSTSGPVTVDLSRHESGVYVVQVRFEDGMQGVQRLVKD